MTDDKKFIETIDASEYEVWTDSGWVDIETSNLTIPYEIWELHTETHALSCADNHIVYKTDGSECFVADLKVGDIIKTETGDEAVTSISKTTEIDNMYDLQLPSNSNHRYYTNGILSHNTTIMTIFALWTTMFSDDATVLIVANKEATAIEILRRIRMAYEMMDNWLKPGVKEWGKTAVTFANDSRIIISSTSSSASRGQTASCLAGETMVTILDKTTNETMDISMESLAMLLQAEGKELQITLVDDNFQNV